MMGGDAESCSSRAVDLAPSQRQSRNQRHKVEVYNEVLCRLKESNDKDAALPGFEDELWAHFCRLPTRYALDVNAERAQDVVMHKRLLQMAHNLETMPAIQVRLVQVPSMSDGHFGDSADDPESSKNAGLQYSDHSSQERHEIHPPPAFGSLPDMELGHKDRDLDVTETGHPLYSRPMHEITISTIDKPKLLSQLTSLLSEIGLNIQEAHAFSTIDGYSLDVFVVDNWAHEKNSRSNSHVIYPILDQPQSGAKLISSHVRIAADLNDVWEIDPNQLVYEKRIASGSSGDLYKGTFCSQDVAIKVLKTEHLNDKLRGEFSTEVFILRVAIDVSRGMQCLHHNNIVHRDLKTANLLMDENGVVKVADFGVARVQDQSGVMTAETGTYRWMAPEVIEHKAYDHKADVFSFGIVLWELLTGKLPYEQLTPLQAAVGVVQQVFLRSAFIFLVG
ncbi:hypothetical protein Tsubulata_043134 [Turnera subulata]|uniref:Protein kinase domain-containing protein n=1 Tax=Turnera subulata TaxID=218843 RepID=A0A9Q0F2Y2_9ROSI|nr:hypothetical protein Tsubulata_043134 [Turnera subulata]